MQLYSEGNNYKLFQGDMLDLLEVIDENSIDAVITDPPYELNFMGKGWDNSGIAFRKDTWEKCLKALKPGGYLLAFGGSRTYHRIACAIEDAGFEIRDCIMRIYGSGFPKSMNLGKSIESKLLNGTANPKDFKDLDGEKVETGNWGISKMTKEQGARPSDYTEDKHLRVDKVNFQTELGKKYEGRGTCLKPSYEIVVVAQKPYSINAYIFIEVINILKYLIDNGWLKLNVKIVERFSNLAQVKQNVEENIVHGNVGKSIPVNEGLSELTDMLQSMSTENMNSNIVSLCLNFLGEICSQLSKYTIEMKTNLIIELKILKSLLVHDISANTTQDKEMKETDTEQNVLTVEKFLREELQKLNYMNTHFVQENVILNERKNNLRPSYEPIIVARKPLEGSCTDNVIKYGVGGINIDECRVGDEERTQFSGRSQAKSTAYSKFPQENAHYKTVQGRFPANTILTYGDDDKEEVCGGFPNTKSTYNKDSKHETEIHRENADTLKYGYKTRIDSSSYNDEGSAARYFYCAKASRRDRDEGIDVGRNGHPTIKPTSLMQYLVRLVTPNGGTVLDPFNGSGSTGKAVMYENKDRNKGYKYIGIELTEEYLPISKARIEYAAKQDDNKEQPPILFSDFAGYDEKNFTD